MCPGSVVRMKKSLEALIFGAISLKRARSGRRARAASMPSRSACLGDRLAVLVGAGQEEDVLAALAHVPGEDVGGDRRVGVPQVGLAVDVVDRGGDVEAHGRLSINSRLRSS